MNDGADGKPGIWASMQRIGDTLLATAQSRVELFAVELQEEKVRLVEAILCAAAVAACGVMTLSILTFTVVVLFWDNGRLTVLITLGFLYLLGTLLAIRALKLRLKARPAFADSLDQIKKDRACLRTDS
jgi:uncharacterized membrane protein YqjE